MHIIIIDMQLPSGVMAEYDPWTAIAGGYPCTDEYLKPPASCLCVPSADW